MDESHRWYGAKPAPNSSISPAPLFIQQHVLDKTPQTAMIPGYIAPKNSYYNFLQQPSITS